MPDDLEDSIIQHQFYLIQLGNWYGKMIDKPLKKVRDYVSARLMQEGDIISSQKDLKKAQKDIKKRSTRELSKFVTEIEKALPTITKQEKEFYSGAIEGAIEEPVKVDEPKNARILATALALSMPIGPKQSGVTLASIINDYTPRETKRIIDRVSAGYSQGESTSQIITGVNGTRRNRYKDGLLNITRSNAFSMTQTMLPQISSVTQEKTNALNPDIVIGYRLVAVLDKNTTDICKGWDGTEIIYKETQRRPHPPFHYNCRTTETPITSNKYDVSQNNYRIAQGADGAQKVSEKTTYYEWLKRQPADFQDDALGKTKGKIFRNAGLSTQAFKQATVRQNGLPLTIDEMARKNKKINSYLNK
jgi:SPP1 gp7 family putative phage head morphogenesis protein